MNRWRKRYTPIISRVLYAHADDGMEQVRAALRNAFPDGPRAYYPYKIWLDECRVQLGLKPAIRADAKRSDMIEAGQIEMQLGVPDD